MKVVEGVANCETNVQVSFPHLMQLIRLLQCIQCGGEMYTLYKKLPSTTLALLLSDPFSSKWVLS